MSIKIKDLSYTYQPNTPHENKALENINLNIDDGEFIGIVGHTGSGKSTLVQHLNGILRPTHGEIYINGLAVHDKKTEFISIIKEVGLVFQYPEHQLFAENCYDEVAFGPKNLGISDADIKEIVPKIMNLVGLPYDEFKDRSPFQLSGGQKRRLSIASILSMDTPIIVLDEPTAGLDPEGRREITAIINDLRKNFNRTVIWITHNLSEIAGFADRLVVMSKGSILIDDKVEKVYEAREKLRESNIRIPDVVDVVYELQHRGEIIKFPVTNIEQAYSAICNWWEGRHD